jgi:hypothetical protein
MGLLLMYLGMPASLVGQATDASLSGTVRNSAGQPLSNAAVKVRNEATGFETGGLTSAQGTFMLRQLPLGGPYIITAG